MKIVPRINEDGLKYIIKKKCIFSSQTLTEGGKWYDDDVLRYIPPIEFNTVKEAVDEIRKQFGKTAKIECWEGE